jgi:hypothetical protein
MTGAERREWVTELVEPEAILWNDCDDAIIGVSGGKVVYGRDALIAVFVAQGMTEEEADEWVGYNIEGAYVGELTPLIVQEIPDTAT